MEKMHASVLVRSFQAAFLAAVALSTVPAVAGPQAVAADSQGNLYIADAAHHVIVRIDEAGRESLIAGRPGVAGNTDASGEGALFDAPSGIAVGGDGSLYVADVNNHSIRKVLPGGRVVTLAGSAEAGSRDGHGAAARFSSPHGVAVDGWDNVYVADTDNSTIRRITPDGEVSTLAGVAGVGGSVDGVGYIATFLFPQKLAVDREGHVYVAEVNAHTIRRISQKGEVSTLAGLANAPGEADGSGSHARFRHPQGLAVAADGSILVVDAGNRKIRRINQVGDVETLADADLGAGLDRLPAGVAISGTQAHVTFHHGESVMHTLATGSMTLAGTSAR